MSAFKVQGWCPGALRPMQSGDGLVVRIRPPLGRLTPAQAKAIAKAAGTHGNGIIVRAVIELKKDTPGHARNAAMIHVAMVSMFVPFCIYVVIAYAP